MIKVSKALEKISKTRFLLLGTDESPKVQHFQGSLRKKKEILAGKGCVRDETIEKEVRKLNVEYTQHSQSILKKGNLVTSLSSNPAC